MPSITDANPLLYDEFTVVGCFSCKMCEFIHFAPFFRTPVPPAEEGDEEEESDECACRGAASVSVSPFTSRSARAFFKSLLIILPHFIPL